MKFEPGQIIRFTYDHQDVDASTGDKHKEVLVLHPFWHNKLQGIDLKRLTPAQRGLIEAILDPAGRGKPHPNRLVSDLRKRLDPVMLVKNPVAFYTRFVKPFLGHNGLDAYRQYIPRRMTNVTVVQGADIKTGKPPVKNPLFGPKPGAPEPGQQTAPKPLTPIDIMVQNAKNKGQK